MRIRTWRRFHERSWPTRSAVKTVVMLLAVAVVLYPKPWLLPTWLERISDMNSVLDPTDPGLAPLEDEVRARLADDSSSEEVLAAVQEVVYARVPYAWDWEVWGVMDYLPTVAETLEQGREDCDGRAVVAASLLRRLGHEAWLVSDIQHTWVQTSHGETMSPGQPDKALVATAEGTQAQLTPAAAASLGRGLVFGITVFPLTRELILVAVFCGVAIHPWSPLWRRIAGSAMLFAALALFRFAPEADVRGALRPELVWSAAIAVLLGIVLLSLRVGGSRSRAALPE